MFMTLLPRLTIIAYQLFFQTFVVSCQKKDIAEAFLYDNHSDIAIFTESWLTSDVENHELLDDASSFFIGAIGAHVGVVVCWYLSGPVSPRARSPLRALRKLYA